jgi:hypothetical protein
MKWKVAVPAILNDFAENLRPLAVEADINPSR